MGQGVGQGRVGQGVEQGRVEQGGVGRGWGRQIGVVVGW